MLGKNNFIQEFEKSIKKNWDLVALIEYPSFSEITYQEFAQYIFSLHLLWRQKGFQKGDKIGIFASNSSSWAVLYFAIISGGYIAVLFPDNFNQESIQHCINLSGCRIIYTDNDDISISTIAASSIDLVVFKNDFFISVHQQTKLYLKKENIHFVNPDNHELCTLIYTSGSLGKPKGVMLNVGMISSILINHINKLPYKCNEPHVNLLPLCHIFGLVVELIIPLCAGMKLVIIKGPSPKIIFEALNIFKPKIIFSVPFILEKIINSIITKETYGLLNENSEMNYYFIKQELISRLGGNINVIFTGGSSIPAELEILLFDLLKLPIITAYGSSETGLVALGEVGKHIVGSTGVIVFPENVRIVFTDGKELGEIQVKNDNIFSGYYNDPEATKAAFTEDGWFKTGDLGYIDEGGYLYITGRCKDMLLTSNGENIYPEDAESVMNASVYIKDSILVQRGEKLHAIIVPDREKANADKLDEESLDKKIDEAVREASKKLPGFTIISSFELRDEPLERTSKGSLKRFLYSEGIKEN